MDKRIDQMLSTEVEELCDWVAEWNAEEDRSFGALQELCDLGAKPQGAFTRCEDYPDCSVCGDFDPSDYVLGD